MNPRALSLLLAVLAAPTGAQEAPPDAPALTAHSFDLANESIKRIVHEAASAQSTLTRAPDDKVPKRAPGEVRYVPPVKAERAEPVAPPEYQASQLPPFLSAFIDVAMNELLGVEEPSTYERWKADRSRDSLEAFRQRAQTPDEFSPSPVRQSP